MLNFNAVSEKLYEQALSTFVNTRSENEFVDGGYVVRNGSNKVIALEMPKADAGTEFYLAIELTDSVH